METLDDRVAEFQERGYTVIEGFLDEAQVTEARQALDEVFATGRSLTNQIYRVAYVLPDQHRLFLSFCQNPRLLTLMEKLLGKEFVVSSLNGFSMTPGGGAQTLHIDQAESVPGTVLTVNALHTIDPFTKENGCTRVVPGSHRRNFRSDFETGAAEKEAIFLEAPAGSLIAYDGGLWHGGSQNRTSFLRRAIHPLFAKSWIRPQWDFSKSLSPKVVAKLSQEQRRLFGFFAPGERE